MLLAKYIYQALLKCQNQRVNFRGGNGCGAAETKETGFVQLHSLRNTSVTLGILFRCYEVLGKGCGTVSAVPFPPQKFTL